MKNWKQVMAAGLCGVTILGTLPSQALAVTGDATAADDTYTGTATTYCDEDEDFVDYSIDVSLTVTDGKIADAAITSTLKKSNTSYATSAMEGILSQIQGKDATADSISGIEAVSGATCSSNAIKEALTSAIAGASEAEAEHTHSYTAEVTKEATCGEAGVKTYTCECGDTYTEEIPATGEHTWNEGEITTEPTTEAEGEKTYTCTVCGATKTEAVDKLEVTETVDLTALNAEIETAAALTEDVYTADSWTTFSAALAAAQEAAAKEDATQEEVDAALAALQAAEAALVALDTEAMTSLSVGGVSYYYTDTDGDKEDTVYTVSVTTGRGANAVTTVTKYAKSDLTQVSGTTYYYTTAPGATALTGTLYGTAAGTGTSSTYTEVYTGLGVSADSSYDTITSATYFTSFHAKDISGTVTYGTDTDGNKVITGVETGKSQKTVSAVDYVEASILNAAGVTLSAAQTEALNITLKQNPMTAASEAEITPVVASATWNTSNYGDGEFAIVPDDTVEGYVWSEYWDNVYAATVSDGTTTVGAVHWIDMYGEMSTSGYHYNKIELALNNGTSLGANKAEVSRYAAFYDANTGRVKAGTYTITIYSDGYAPLVAEVTIPSEAMSSVSVGGVTYYYTDTTDDAATTVYTVSVTTGRGANATTTVYNYTKSDLTTIDDESGILYIVAPGATALTGTLYGSDPASGTATNYKTVYTDMGVSADDSYDVITSATGLTSYHAKDISSPVTYTTAEDGTSRSITGLQLNRTAKTVDATAYVGDSILKAAGEELTDVQEEVLNIDLKQNPMVAPSESTVDVQLSSASWSTSRYGTGEFVIVPDDTVEGYVWSEYWDNVYAATVSDGTTTVGAVHWIDLYGEASTSGAHYNKIELALNNGTSVGANAAEVARYAAFYDATTGNVKAGTYTITIYAEGYTALTAEVTIPSEAMSSVSIGDVTYYYADTTDDDTNTVYTVSVTQGRGTSATTTVYNYLQSDLTAIGETGIAYIVAPGATALTGTLYGTEPGSGTATNYKTVYTDLEVEADDSYDAITSATGLTSYHAKDISSTVTYTADEDGNRTITGLLLQKTAKTVDADTYVTASILSAAGQELTEEQQEALNIDLKQNPMSAAPETTVEVKAASAEWTTSRYGTGEFVIVPDETVEGYVWAEYWDNVYAVTVSDGTTTVGAVHWIDLYGEKCTSGYHYNKIELALNNGTSVGANAAEVNRFAAFYDEEGNVKVGTYTITIYSDGYTPLVAEVTVEEAAEEDTESTDETVTDDTNKDNTVTDNTGKDSTGNKADNKTSDKTAKNAATDQKTVKTGDENSLFIWLFVLVAICAAYTGIVFARRKRA